MAATIRFCGLVSGKAYTWGLNTEGQCGCGEEDEISIPTEIEWSKKIVSISCGYYHTAFVTGENCHSSL